jgi:hypothetical protein
MSKKAHTKTATFDDGTFERTALVLEGGDTGSVDLVTKDGERRAQINISFMPDSDGEECLIVDVIDVEGRYTVRRALTFAPSKRASMNVPKDGNLVSTDFRRAVAHKMHDDCDNRGGACNKCRQGG